jgi:hypothetical protein
VRLEGWEKRLFAELEAARHKPYVLGEHDCFRVACRVVDALTGADHWPAWGTYRTKREALQLLASKGHPTFEDAFDWLFGVARVSVRLARRGARAEFVKGCGCAPYNSSSALMTRGALANFATVGHSRHASWNRPIPG